MDSVLLHVRVNPEIKERALINAKLAGTTLSAVVNGFLTKFANDRVVAKNDFLAECRRQSLSLSGDAHEKNVLDWAMSAQVDGWK